VLVPRSVVEGYLSTFSEGAPIVFFFLRFLKKCLFNEALVLRAWRVSLRFDEAALASFRSICAEGIVVLFIDKGLALDSVHVFM